MQTRLGQSIEDASMRIIEQEIGDHPYGAAEWPIVRRVIHSTADFDFARDGRMVFQPSAIRSGMDALRGGCTITCDVNGVLGLLNKSNLSEFGNNAVCRISQPEIAEMAQKNNSTRARTAMRYGAHEIEGGIVVIGNAPTALLEIISMVRSNTIRPALIVGMPVGFIQAAESKAELDTLKNTPYITNRGRKGGSAAAAAIINALFILVRSSL